MTPRRKAYVVAALALLVMALSWLGYQKFWRASLFHRPPEESKPLAPEAPILEPGPRVAVVIDDVAYDMNIMDRFASLGIPLTFAILPRHKLANALSEKATALQFAVMLHLPMEPLDVVQNNPGPAALYLHMTDQELKHQFDRAVQSVPNLVGINNHMGSAFTESEPKMTLLLGWVKERNYYFLDSYTSTRSVVMRVAKRLDVPCLRNETFLDGEDSIEAIEKQLEIVQKLALKRKQTIAIGHYRRKFLVEALARKVPEFQALGIEFVTLPTLYQR